MAKKKQPKKSQKPYYNIAFYIDQLHVHYARSKLPRKLKPSSPPYFKSFVAVLTLVSTVVCTVIWEYVKNLK